MVEFFIFKGKNVNLNKEKQNFTKYFLKDGLKNTDKLQIGVHILVEGYKYFLKKF